MSNSKGQIDRVDTETLNQLRYEEATKKNIDQPHLINLTTKGPGAKKRN